MSRVVITDLVPGTEATSADVNATITSWNNAAGAGDLGANNVRQEGIDRRTLSYAGQAIQSVAGGAYADVLYTSSGSSGAVTNAGPYAVISLGGVAMQAGDNAAYTNSSHQKVVRASVTFRAANLCLVDCTLQSASTNAGPWTSHTNTRQRFLIVAGVTAAAGCVGTYTTSYEISAGSGYQWWRVAYTATPGNVTFQYGTLYIETYSK